MPACVHVSPSPWLPPTCRHPRRTISSHTCIRPPKANPIRESCHRATGSPLRFFPSPRDALWSRLIPSTAPILFLFFFNFSFASFLSPVAARFVYFCILLAFSPQTLDSFPFPRFWNSANFGDKSPVLSISSESQRQITKRRYLHSKDRQEELNESEQERRKRNEMKQSKDEQKHWNYSTSRFWCNAKSIYRQCIYQRIACR